MESNTSNVIFKITAIAAAVSLIGWIVCSALKPKVTDTKIINDYFLSTLKMNKICERLSGGFVFLLIFLIAAVLVMYFGETLDLPRLFMSGIILVICGLIFFCIPLAYMFPLIFHKPEIQTVTVTDTYAEYRGAKFKSMHYGVVLSNGTRHALEYDEYAAAKAGDQYYAVMCGDLNIGIYKTSDHTVS